MSSTRAEPPPLPRRTGLGRTIRGLAAAAVLLAAAPAGGAVRLEAAREGEAARLALSWEDAVSVTAERQGRELVLRFDRPLGDAPLERIPADLQGWVDNVLYGYDSLLLVLSAGVDAAVEPAGTGVRIAFTPAGRPPPDPAAAAERRAAERRLEYFRAVTLLEEGAVAEARAGAAALVESDPADALSTALLANAEERLGRWREAVRLYDRALLLTPGEPSLIRSKAGLLREHGDRARVETDLVSVEDADTQRIGRVIGRFQVGSGADLSYTLETRHVEVDRAVRADGRIAPFDGRRTRGELTLARDWPDLQRSGASLFLADRTVGVGLFHAVRTVDGLTRAGAVWHEPTYTFIEGIIGGGRRDRLSVQHERRLSPRWSATLGAGLSRYGLENDPDLARSATVEGSLRYTLSLGEPFASVAYVVDAEYVADRTSRIAPDGTPFAPLPLVTREVHALQLGLDDDLTDYLRYSVQGGYAYDRRNTGGPFAAASLAYEPLPDLEVGVRASHALSTARGSDAAVTTASGYLLFRY